MHHLIHRIFAGRGTSQFDTIQWNKGKRYLQVAMLVNGSYQPLGDVKEIVHPPFAGGKELWIVNGGDIYRTTGNVAIGTTNTQLGGKLSIFGRFFSSTPQFNNLKLGDFNANYNQSGSWSAFSGSIGFHGGGWHDGFFTYLPHAPDGNSYFQIAGLSFGFNDVRTGLLMKGPLRINHRFVASDPDQTSIMLGDPNVNYNSVASVTNYSGCINFVGAGWNNGFLTFIPHHPDGGSYFKFAGQSFNFDDAQTGLLVKGKIGIGTSFPTAELDVNGNTRTNCLTITGGCDITEPFPNAQNETLMPGSVVVIDEDHPGMIRLATTAYDTKVAGVISGAGDVKPGLSLSQAGVLDNGQQMALAGRVYVRVSASNGPIRPGDLLTSSDLPGIAMKATDRNRSQGTVLGKAMSRLDSGEGLVLVLVGLQ